MKRFVKFILAVVLLFVPSIVPAANNSDILSSEELFTKIEENTLGIESISLDLFIYDKIASSSASFSVKSPNKFAITFSDNSVGIYFNGSKLCVYIKSLKEVYVQSLKQDSLISSSLSLLFPGSLFKKITAASMKTLFDIKSVGNKTIKGKKYHMMDFIPKMDDFFAKVFNACQYRVYFDGENFLPARVEEFKSASQLGSVLEVKSFEINNEIKDEKFDFIKPSNVAAMPISVVILQRIEDYFDELKTKCTNFFGF